jgi:hypothetical protein
MFYGGVSHMRKHPESQQFVMKYLSKKNQERFLSIVAPKTTMNMEQATTNLKKIRSLDENCLQEGGDKSNCRFAAKPVLEEKFKGAASGDNPLGKAARQLIQVEKARFEQFDKLDKITE